MAKGFINENSPGFSRLGILKRMLMPRLRNGLVKSTYCSLS